MSRPPAALGVIPADISRIIKHAPNDLIGRDAETKLLKDAWAKARKGTKKRPRVLTFVALGGEGKTSLVAKWAADLEYENWPGCDAVFAWSFYSQGTREQTAVSSDAFLAAALTFFGDPAAVAGSGQPFEQGGEPLVLEFARRGRGGSVLQRLQAIEDEQRPPLADELGQPPAFVERALRAARHRSVPTWEPSPASSSIRGAASRLRSRKPTRPGC